MPLASILIGDFQTGGLKLFETRIIFSYCSIILIELLGLEKILTDNRAQYGATKDQMNDFKLDLIKADHENSIQSYIRDFCRLYR